MSAALDADPIGSARRWAMLGASTLAQAASAVLVHGPAFLIPVLVGREGLSLAHAGVVAAAPTAGVLLTLVLWGAVADRHGERLVLLLGLMGASLAGLAAVVTDGLVALTLSLLLGGAAAASTNSATGRVVVGWFPAHRRGLAMGVRQMAQPAGVGIAAVTIAVVADRAGIGAALVVPTVACAVAALVVAVVVLDPPRPERTAARAPSPYRGDRFLARVHGASVLLVVPQFVVWTFALAWLVQDRGWSPAAAGTLVAVTQVGGALGRIGVGQLSDVVASRMRPLRWVAWSCTGVMALLGLLAGLDIAVAVLVLVVAATVTVAPNGLAFTGVAERAGPFWSGRALGLQNTAQFATATVVPPVAGLVITHTGYGWAFALAAVPPLLAVALVPVRAEHPLR